MNSGAAKIAQDCLIALKKECLTARSKINESFLKTAIQQLLNTHPMATIGNALFPIYIRLVQLINEGNLKKIDYKPSIEMLTALAETYFASGSCPIIEYDTTGLWKTAKSIFYQRCLYYSIVRTLKNE